MPVPISRGVKASNRWGIVLLKNLALWITPALVFLPSAVSADDFYCYLETDEGQTVNLGEICGGDAGFGSNLFSAPPRIPTTDAEAAFLREYTIAFFARDPELAPYAPTEADLVGAFSDRNGFEEILNNAERVCQGQPPLWFDAAFAELVFPDDTWTEFVQGLNTFAPLCAAAE
jgi:hypothetical protein